MSVCVMCIYQYHLYVLNRMKRDAGLQTAQPISGGVVTVKTAVQILLILTAPITDLPFFFGKSKMCR